MGELQFPPDIMVKAYKLNSWPGVINSSKAAMSNFSKIIENFVRVLPLEQFRDVGVLEGPRSRGNRHPAGLKGAPGDLRQPVNLPLHPSP